jgi:aerobic C4-dicarboxylate transport protein
MAETPSTPKRGMLRRIDRNHYLYIAVIVAVAAGAIVGLATPEFAKTLDPVGKGFVLLIKMMITPVIFCTIVIGVGSIAKAATVGKIGGLAIGYFLIMSTFALGIGLVVGNLLHPGTGLNIATSTYKAVGEPLSGTDFILGIIPETLFSSFTSGSILQVLLVALLVGFALQGLGDKGTSILEAVKKL